MIEFERVYFEYAESVFRFVFNMCGNSSLAEKITEKTFRRAFSTAAKYKGKVSEHTWLCAVALKTFIRRFNKPKPDGSDERIPADREGKLRHAILSMPDMYRDTLILRLYGGISFTEISSLMKISPNSAKVIYCKAKRTLSEVV